MLAVKVSAFLCCSLLYLAVTAIESNAQGIYEAWIQRYDGPGQDSDLPTGLAIDDFGNVYVTGYSTGASTQFDYATIKYSPQGDSLWVRRYDGTGSKIDRAFAIAVDSNGSAYVGGESSNDVAFDFAVVKYDSSGNVIWVRTYDGPVGEFDEINALTLDGNGYLYVTGNSWGINSVNDYLVIKYTVGGDSVWAARYNGDGNGHDAPWDIAVDDSGNVYTTGYSQGIGGDYDYATVKFSPTGETLWVRRYASAGNVNDLAWSLALDDSRNVYVTGNTATIKYSPNGDSVWVRTDVTGDKIAYSSSGKVLVVGSAKTYQCNPDGQLMWQGNPGGVDLVADDSGNVYVTGGSTFAQTAKYDSSGNLLWTKQYDGPGNGPDAGQSLALDNNGNLLVAGYSTGDGTGYDYVTIKYSPCQAIPGDANSDGALYLGDIIASANFVFNRTGWPDCNSDAPICWLSELLCRGDWNGSGVVNLGDIIHAVNYLFGLSGGPWEPVIGGACCIIAPE